MFRRKDLLTWVLCIIINTCFKKQCGNLTLCFLFHFLSALNGVAKLWSMPKVQKVSTLKGHTERLTDVTFSPTDNLLATASADRTARLWNTEGSHMKTFEGHLDRLARICFHPSGKYLGTASFDKTWRLWDVETGAELLLQEGHSRGVYGIDFHQDGSLAASCGLDSLARVWDLRTGRSILALEGHVKPVRLSNSWAFLCSVACRLLIMVLVTWIFGLWLFFPFSSFVIIGSWVKLLGKWLLLGHGWRRQHMPDMGFKKEEISVHHSSSLQANFSGQIWTSRGILSRNCLIWYDSQGTFHLQFLSTISCYNYLSRFITFLSIISFCLHDFQIWSARDFKPVKTLSGHEAKVTALDVAAGKFLGHEKRITTFVCFSICEVLYYSVSVVNCHDFNLLLLFLF